MIIVSVYYKHKAGGFNRRLYRLYRALADRGHQVHYLALEALPLRHAKIQPHVVRLPLGSKENTLFWSIFLLAAPLCCLWIAWRYRADRIVVFSSVYAAIGAPAAGLLRIPMVTFLRADVLREARFERKSRLRRLFLRALDTIGVRSSTLVLTNSVTLSDRVSYRYHGLRTRVVANSIETDVRLNAEARRRIRQRHGCRADDFVVLTAAPFNPVKNIAFLIQAFAACGLPTAVLWLIGDDVHRTGERRRLERLVSDLDLEKRVCFTGWLDDPRPTIAAGDLFVFPSLQEGCPNGLLEALACNLACLGSRIPEIGEILHHDPLLFSLKSTEELKRKIRKAAGNTIYLNRLTELCRERKQVYRFDWDTRVVAQIVNPK